ncbi:hypothetical protein IJ384_02355 [bacterium]|nr:hypothetical protein [bacterium]
MTLNTDSISAIKTVENTNIENSNSSSETSKEGIFKEELEKKTNNENNNDDILKQIKDLEAQKKELENNKKNKDKNNMFTGGLIGLFSSFFALGNAANANSVSQSTNSLRICYDKLAFLIKNRSLRSALPLAFASAFTTSMILTGVIGGLIASKTIFGEEYYDNKISNLDKKITEKQAMLTT